MRQQYRVLNDRIIRGTVHAKCGDIVHRYDGYDYGLSADDTHATGRRHISVTLSGSEDPAIPFFTIATADLEQIVTDTQPESL